jgi:sulfatase-like protein
VDIVSTRTVVVRWSVLAAALVLLNLSLTFVNVWPTLFVRLTTAVSIEAALLVLLIVVTRARIGPPPRAVLRMLGVLWVVLVVGRYADVTSRSLYGRDINLYWDVRYMPDVGSMLAVVANPWWVAVILAGALILPLVAYTLIRWALGCVSDATHDPSARRALAALAVTVLACGIAPRVDARIPEVLEVAAPVTPAFMNQARRFAYELSGAGMRALPPATPIASDLARVRGADVFLIFIESYGQVSWDRPAFVTALASSRAGLEAAIRDTGREVVSASIESSTFGGESWLAHISLLTGTEVRDQDTNVRLMAQPRDTMVTAFARQGYRTVAVMPGLQREWPEGRFYRFDQVYGSHELGYHGPPFGWWDVTDQYVLARLDALSLAVRSSQPLFVFFPTISTHTPFTPTPPYQRDWKRILTTTPYDADELDRAWSQPPDWLNLGPGYTQALDYIHATLGGYLRLHSGRDLVMILIGDHQPPAAVTGEGASWDVPMHVIASRRELLDRLLQHGFRKGLAPTTQPLMKINAMLPVLLDGFGEVSSTLAAHR